MLAVVVEPLPVLAVVVAEQVLLSLVHRLVDVVVLQVAAVQVAGRQHPPST